MRRLRRSFYARDAVEVARDLLGKVLVAGPCSGRIVETEAYRPDDPASHSFRGKTPRNSVMFGAPGHLYVYFTYGMHYCANVVTGGSGEGSAVLIRALAPIDGLRSMRARRKAARSDLDLANGPAKVCQALGIALGHNGVDLTASPGLCVVDDGTVPERIGTSARIGISTGTDLQWRFFVEGDPHVSRRSGQPGRRTSAP